MTKPRTLSTSTEELERRAERYERALRQIYPTLSGSRAGYKKIIEDALGFTPPTFFKKGKP